MSVWLTALVGGIYLAVAVSEVLAGRYGYSLMFASYAMANVGLIWAMNV